MHRKIDFAGNNTDFVDVLLCLHCLQFPTFINKIYEMIEWSCCVIILSKYCLSLVSTQLNNSIE